MEMKCILLGHDLKIMPDRKTLLCKRCKSFAVMKKSRIDEAWVHFQGKRFICFNGRIQPQKERKR